MVFQYILCDNTSFQDSRTLLSILSDLNRVVVWMDFSRVFISNSYCPFTNLLVTVPSSPVTIGITVSFMFYIFSVLWQCPGIYLSFRLPLVLPCRNRKVHYSAVFPFFLLISGGLVVWPGLGDPFEFQIPGKFMRLTFDILQSFTVSFTKTLGEVGEWFYVFCALSIFLVVTLSVT